MSEVADINEVEQKMHLTGKVIKVTLAGAIVDIGLDSPGVLHISQISREPVKRVEDSLEVGQGVDVWVRRVDKKKGRVELTMIEPLDLEWREIKKGMVVKGTVTRLENFGAFIEIGAERPGLAHVSELAHEYVRKPSDMVEVGDEVEVKVLGVNRRKKQIKLSMKALQEEPDSGPEEQISSEPAPTAMEVALRKAMEESETEETGDQGGKAQSSKSSQEIEDILSRTLENKVRAK